MIGPVDVTGPSPAIFDGVIVKTYSVNMIRSGNVSDVPVVVWVVDGGDDVMVYRVARGAAIHVRSTVVSVGLLAAKSVTGPQAATFSTRIRSASDKADSNMRTLYRLPKNSKPIY
jgi:hypothetical protein